MRYCWIIYDGMGTDGDMGTGLHITGGMPGL